MLSITVEKLDGNVALTCTLTPNEKVAAVKEKLRAEAGAPQIEQQSLMLGSKLLDKGNLPSALPQRSHMGPMGPKGPIGI